MSLMFNYLILFLNVINVDLTFVLTVPPSPPLNFVTAGFVFEAQVAHAMALVLLCDVMVEAEGVVTVPLIMTKLSAAAVARAAIRPKKLVVTVIDCLLMLKLGCLSRPCWSMPDAMQEACQFEKVRKRGSFSAPARVMNPK